MVDRTPTLRGIIGGPWATHFMKQTMDNTLLYQGPAKLHMIRCDNQAEKFCQHNTGIRACCVIKKENQRMLALSYNLSVGQTSSVALN